MSISGWRSATLRAASGGGDHSAAQPAVSSAARYRAPSILNPPAPNPCTIGPGPPGVGALFALFHDVALTLGFFALTQLEFDLNIVAAILTIIGYSLNDTIVVYDRIRENLRRYRKMAIEPLLDLSINETLSRTVVTSLSIGIVLTVLLVLGPDVIFGFTAAMLLGIVIGTFSSVYVSAAILLWLRLKPDSFVAQGAAESPGGAERITPRSP